ncbi:hypothetical protein [Agrobacterium tumefaciens]|uniref:hypothetical protein n=1 Tax=Agrobacterium tumefaciens TaxID=358 RepID=UPI0010DA4CB2|nr:hypothetical protein [Agrobacterium tumefaciens]TCV55157.1 hypothetical protein EDB97_101249 [Agrobacterium tumefaciens]
MEHGFSIEEIHEMLDGVERSLTKLRSANLHSKAMPVSFISDAVSVIYELDSAGVLTSAGITRTLAIKLKNFDGSLQANVMFAALERIRTYLRRIESEFGGRDSSTEADRRMFELDSVVERNPPPPVPVWAETWVFVAPGSRAKQIIGEISDLLDEVLILAKSTNLPEDQAALTDIERAQLIALLETALLMLKGPLIEKGLLKKLGNAAADAATKAAQKGAEQGMSEAAKAVAPKIWDLIKWLIS